MKKAEPVQLDVDAETLAELECVLSLSAVSSKLNEYVKMEKGSILEDLSVPRGFFVNVPGYGKVFPGASNPATVDGAAVREMYDAGVITTDQLFTMINSFNLDQARFLAAKAVVAGVGQKAASFNPDYDSKIIKGLIETSLKGIEESVAEPGTVLEPVRVRRVEEKTSGNGTNIRRIKLRGLVSTAKGVEPVKRSSKKGVKVA